MDNTAFHIKGLSGRKKLEGEIPVYGAKNAALKALAASLLFEGELKITNVPDIEDVHRMYALVEKLGCECRSRGRSISVVPSKNPESTIDPEISSRLRASIVLAGPLLARTGKVVFPHPGGCVIGERPIDLFVEGFKKMGAQVKRKKDVYTIESPKGGLAGAKIFFRNPSVTATETFLMAGVLARGTTEIHNAAMEPEIASLAEFLQKSGARIDGIGTPTLTIKGTNRKCLKAKTAYSVPPDRIEAGSFLILAALAGKDITVKGAEPAHLESVLATLKDMGVAIERGKHTLRVKGSAKRLRSVDIKTHEYPGFPTDLQAPMTVLLTQAHGEAQVFETIFEDRLRYIDELVRMGADITAMDPHRILVHGPRALRGRELESPDLRAGLAYVLAGIVAKGDSVIHNVYNIDRGYERVEERLQEIGVEIERIGS